MKKPRLVFGKPISFHEYIDQENSHKVLRWVTNEVMGAIQAIHETEYVDVYVNRVKYGDLKGAPLDKYILSHPNDGVEKPPTTAELSRE